MPTYNSYSMVNAVVLTVIVALFKINRVSAECNHGAVRLVNGSLASEGRVEVCVNSVWGTVCDAMGWGREDAEVICRQLGYTPEGAMNRSGGYYGQGEGPVWLDNVRCNLTLDMSILECPHRPIPMIVSRCNHTRDAGVECRDDQGEAKNVKATIINPGPAHSVMISWELGNSTRAGAPIIFEIECNSETHSIAISVSSQTSTVSLGGLLPSTSYNCCVSAVYQLYTARRICTHTRIETTTITEEKASNSVNVIGGVLGFIVAVLLVLLALSGTVLLFQLRPQWKGRLRRILARLPKSRFVNRSNTMDMPVRSNLSYATTPPPHSTTKSCGAVPPEAGSADAIATTIVTEQDEAHGDGPDYSCLGPQYETIDSSSREPQGKNEAATRARLLSERYEYSETHCVVAATDGRTTEESTGYESIKQNQCTAENEEYSHLKH